MNFIEVRKSSSGPIVPGSTCAQIAVPSSVRLSWCSTCPCGLSTRASALVPGAQLVQLLGGQAVQPAQPVRTGNPQHAAMRPVDHAVTAGERSLLGVRVTVVGGDARVGPVGRDRTGLSKQRAVHRPDGRHEGEAATFPSLRTGILLSESRLCAGSAAAAGPAVGAQAEDREMRHIGEEALPLLKLDDKRADR